MPYSLSLLIESSPSGVKHTLARQQPGPPHLAQQLMAALHAAEQAVHAVQVRVLVLLCKG